MRTGKVLKLVDTQTVLEDAMRNNITVLEKALSEEKKKLERYLASKRPVKTAEANIPPEVMAAMEHKP